MPPTLDGLPMVEPVQLPVTTPPDATVRVVMHVGATPKDAVAVAVGVGDGSA